MCTSLKTRCACAQSLHSCLTLCDPRTVAHQAALSMGILQARYWSGLLCPLPEDLPDPGIQLAPPVSPALQAASLPLSHWAQGVPICSGKKGQVHAIVLCSFRSPTYWTDQGSRAVFVAHSWIHLFEFSACHWPVVVLQNRARLSSRSQVRDHDDPKWT